MVVKCPAPLSLGMYITHTVYNTAQQTTLQLAAELVLVFMLWYIGRWVVHER